MARRKLEEATAAAAWVAGSPARSLGAVDEEGGQHGEGRLGAALRHEIHGADLRQVGTHQDGALWRGGGESAAREGRKAQRAEVQGLVA